MKIDVRQLYVEGSLTFSYKTSVLLDDELSPLTEASPTFLRRYSPEYRLSLWMSTKQGTSETVVTGPGVYKKDKRLDFSIFLPFDVILRAPDGPQCALRFFFDGVRTVLRRYNIDTTKVDANEKRIIEEICSNPEMFNGGWENRPWPTLDNYKPPPPPPPAPEGPTRPAFKRVYKRIDGVLHFEAVGAHDGMAYHNKGKVGHPGKGAELPYAGNSPQKAVDTFLGVAIAKGFTELPKDHEIEIQYALDGMGTPEDFDKLSDLEDHLHDLLGTLGLGVCMENSIGGDTMEVSCLVVDADIAMKCIKKNLKGTRFGDYASIHVVEQDEGDDEET